MAAEPMRNIAFLLLLVQLVAHFPTSTGLKCYEGGAIPKLEPMLKEVNCTAGAQCGKFKLNCTSASDQTACKKALQGMLWAYPRGKVDEAGVEATEYRCVETAKTQQCNSTETLPHGGRHDISCCSEDLCNGRGRATDGEKGGGGGGGGGLNADSVKTSLSAMFVSVWFLLFTYIIVV